MQCSLHSDNCFFLADTQSTGADLSYDPLASFARSSPQDALGKVTLPWLLMTGTNDISRIGNTDLDSRLAVFPALPPGDKYELVLYGAEHSAFTDRDLPGNHPPRNPNHHRVILALTTAFRDTYLRNDAAAREWLRGDGPNSVLEENDRWRLK